VRNLDPSLPSLLATARDLRDIARRRDDVADRLRLLGGKGRSLVRGLYYLLKTNKEEALSIGTFLVKNAENNPGGAALLYQDERYTHRDMDQLSNRWAHLLAARGVKKGDAVAVLVDNRPEILFAIGGVVKLGAVAAVINTKQRQSVLEHSFRVSGARAFIIGEELWDAFAEIRASLGEIPADRAIWVRDRGQAKAPESASDAEAALAVAPSYTPRSLASVKLGDPCFYVYTSGTTGLPKASIMSHFRWVKAAAAFGSGALSLGPDDVLYVPLPLYHNNALTVAWGSAAATGAAMAIRRKFSATHFWEDVRRHDATAFIYIGELCRYLLNQPPSPDDRRHRVRRIAGNGLRPDIWRAFKERFGIEQVYEFYAASEGNVAFVNMLNLDATVGFCPAKYEIVKYDIDADRPIRDGRGHLVRVPRGGVGLLIGEISDRYTFDGYTDKRASEKKVFRDAFAPGDAWFDSGDLVRDQGFGHVQFVDRVGDTFRWKGENVSTNEVAEILNLWPDIAESTVYGVTVPGAEGRCGMASIVTRSPIDRLDLAGLAAHVREHLPSYAWPRFLRVQTEIEVTGTFKQLKGELRKQGFDPALVGDPLFVLPGRGEAYVKLDDDVFQAIGRGEIAL
jgi:acyl-CoA synthetase (AMP-forming)/AMP-acid ligase II